MNLYIIDKIGEVEYNSNIGFVVAAESESAAREFAHKEGWGTEIQENLWHNPLKVSCKLIGRAEPTVKEGIVFESRLD